MTLLRTSSPHIHSGKTTNKLMRDVVIALLPASLVGIYIFGLRALVTILLSMAASLLTELVCSGIARRGFTLKDGSAAVTGLLLALTLPASAPYWVPVLGGVVAILLGKALLGGLGQNPFNPALAARAFLMLVVPSALTRFPEAGVRLSAASMSVDLVSSATPLHHMVMPALPELSLLDAFLGNMAGCIGEVSALALLIGGIYLLVRKVISWQIPVGYLGAVAVLTLIFSRGQNPVLWMSYELLCGGLLLGAFFMATDYATSPVTPLGQLLYGLGCGVLTVVFRYFGLFPEGVTYAILLMNVCAWGLDRLVPPKRFTSVPGGAAK